MEAVIPEFLVYPQHVREAVEAKLAVASSWLLLDYSMEEPLG